MVPCSHPKRSHAVPIGRVLAGCSCTSGGVVLGRTEEHSSLLACRWLGASPDGSRSVRRLDCQQDTPLGRVFLGAALVRGRCWKPCPISNSLKHASRSLVDRIEKMHRVSRSWSLLDLGPLCCPTSINLRPLPLQSTCPLPQSWTMDVASGGSNVCKQASGQPGGPASPGCLPLSRPISHAQIGRSSIFSRVFGVIGTPRPARPGLTRQEFGEIRAQIDSLALCSQF